VPSVFVDTSYYIAVLIKDDAFHGQALRLGRALSEELFVTTDPALTEVLAYVARRGSHTRALALELVHEIRSSPAVTIIRQTPELFDAGLDLYGRRLDKAYSLTDCMSMVICRRRRIADVLTHDGHFAQEGFEVLL